jgi:hypothetical protein
MAKIKDFLEQLDPGTYTDEQLRTLGGEFDLTQDQIDDVVSHDLNKVRNAIKRESGNPKGELLRVIM